MQNEKVVRYKSRSNPRVVHSVKIVTKGRGYKIRCSCKGFNMKGNCWHVADQKEKLSERVQ